MNTGVLNKFIPCIVKYTKFGSQLLQACQDLFTSALSQTNEAETMTDDADLIIHSLQVHIQYPFINLFLCFPFFFPLLIHLPGKPR